jgi:macrolide transport system ATP-binding/permease protein
LLLGSVPSRIIGVIDAQQGFMGNSDSLNVYLPYSTVMSRMLGQSNVRSIIVRIKDEYPSSAAENAI